MSIRTSVYVFNFEISKSEPRHYESRMNVSLRMYLFVFCEHQLQNGANILKCSTTDFSHLQLIAG